MPENTTRYEEYGKSRLNQQPRYDFSCVGLTEEFLAVLDAEDALAEHDGAIHPALSSHALASRVRCVDVILSTMNDKQSASLLIDFCEFSHLTEGAVNKPIRTNR